MTAGDEQMEEIWGAILLAATEIGVELKPDTTRHLRWLLAEGFRIHGPAGTLGWLGIDPESRLPLNLSIVLAFAERGLYATIDGRSTWTQLWPR